MNPFIVRAGFGAMLLLGLATCGGGAAKRSAGDAAGSRSGEANVLMDFEAPDPGVRWVADQPTSAPTTGPATAPAVAPPAVGVLNRSSLRPHTGLWSLNATLSADQPGTVVHSFGHAVDMRNADTIVISVMQMGDPGRSGEWSAAVELKDQSGKRVMGDAFAVTSRWQEIVLDLTTAREEGLDISQVVDIGVAFVHHGSERAGPLDVQTDTWRLQKSAEAYVGQRGGTAKMFYVEREGTELHVGVVGRYEMTFFQRGGTELPWLRVTRSVAGHSEMVLGQPGTGLMLLDQEDYDGLLDGARHDAYEAGGEQPAVRMPTASWPENRDGGHQTSRWSWECIWTSPVAAIVEVKEEVGPYDHLGEPAASLKWRFMIYQWGQVFVHAEWAASDGVKKGAGRPISWALVSDAGISAISGTEAKREMPAKSAADRERLLSAIYPAAVREGAIDALPHEMQRGAAVAMIAKTAGIHGGWWWARQGDRRIFGVGIAQPQGPADCMLLVGSPSALMQAGSFSQYLFPPKVRVRQGELDRNFPGDFDNDGLVEPYGFQVIRLANGRTSFMVYPQERPLFYPPYLFTVPAVERETVDVKNSRVLINIDGQQFADPAQFPDGSFLLQMPYVIDRPVQVEGILIRK